MTSVVKPVTRLTMSKSEGRPIIVSVHPTYLSFRLRYSKRTYTLDLQAAYYTAVRLHVEAQRAEKAAEKKLARKVKRKSI